MKEHRKKMTAPIIITVLVILYYIFYFGMIITTIEPKLAKILLGVIPLILSAVSICVCVQRIREIKGGEEDDLDKY
ncbi:MAG: hypothetical protein MJ059_07505 [Lachnospiraceae bacterium]|nr:hypothetical protein [Lachnospiraceae bacterium]